MVSSVMKRRENVNYFETIAKKKKKTSTTYLFNCEK